MAQKIAVFPKATRRSKYDVNTWFNGEIWKLIQGEDFNVPVASFRGSLYNQANKKGFEIQTSVLNEGGTVSLVVQQIGLKQEKPAEEPAASAPRNRRNTKAAKTAA